MHGIGINAMETFPMKAESRKQTVEEVKVFARLGS
jgi:hypothetical protein